ncbi:5,6-dimethylbenzimidazole synthase [Sphingomonas sp. 4RDLI-65]|uniref:5,6-dimethylbenzimidazole synthase n=1 Tax=Sphingomonas sp. 4RDLI-65 TaxID=3111641 RepID=UPI003C255035
MTPPSTPPIFDTRFQDRLDDLFRWRRDVRRFRTDALPAGLLDRLLTTADTAPSVGLSQPWRFVTIDDPARRAAVRADFEACNAAALAAQADARANRYAHLKLAGLDRAPCHLAVFVEPDPTQGHGLGRQTMPESVSFSAVIAIHTLWLSARTHGIGLGWVSILDPDRICTIADVPDSWRLIGYLCLGYTEEEAISPELERAGWETRRPTPRLSR